MGYRVKSHRGTQFRIWATQRLREYIIKGFALDDERLKQAGGGNYFDELLARNRKPMYMIDWIAKLDDFLRMGERDILTHSGRISHEAALAKAEMEFEAFRALEAERPSQVEFDFEEALKKLSPSKHSKNTSDKGS